MKKSKRRKRQIILKTGNRKTTVTRQQVRDAIALSYQSDFDLNSGKKIKLRFK